MALPPCSPGYVNPDLFVEYPEEFKVVGLALSQNTEQGAATPEANEPIENHTHTSAPKGQSGHLASPAAVDHQPRAPLSASTIENARQHEDVIEAQLGGPKKPLVVDNTPGAVKVAAMPTTTSPPQPKKRKKSVKRSVSAQVTPATCPPVLPNPNAGSIFSTVHNAPPRRTVSGPARHHTSPYTSAYGTAPYPFTPSTTVPAPWPARGTATMSNPHVDTRVHQQGNPRVNPQVNQTFNPTVNPGASSQSSADTHPAPLEYFWVLSNDNLLRGISLLPNSEWAAKLARWATNNPTYRAEMAASGVQEVARQIGTAIEGLVTPGYSIDNSTVSQTHVYNHLQAEVANRGRQHPVYTPAQPAQPVNNVPLAPSNTPYPGMARPQPQPTNINSNRQTPSNQEQQPPTVAPRARPTFTYRSVQNPEAFPLDKVHGLHGAKVASARLLYRINVIYEVDLYLTYPDDPGPRPGRYTIICIQDPKMIAAMGIKKSTKEIGINATWEQGDVLSLDCFDPNGPNAHIALLGCPRFTYEYWQELTNGDKPLPEDQECMHIAAELGRSVDIVRAEIYWYLDALNARIDEETIQTQV